MTGTHFSFGPMKRILPCLIFLAAVFAAGLAVGGTTAACNGVPYQVRDSIAGCQPVPGAAPTNPNCITLRGEKPRAVGDKCNVAQSRGLTDVLYAAPPAPAIEVAHSPVPVAAAPPPVAKTIERAIPGRTTPVLSEPRTAQHRQPVADPWIILPAMLLAGLIGYVYGFAAESGDARDPRASQHATSSKVLFAVAGALVPLDFSQNLFDLTNAIDNKAVADFWQATTFFNWIFAAAWIVIVVFGVPLVLFANYLIIGAAFILALLKLRAAV